MHYSWLGFRKHTSENSLIVLAMDRILSGTKLLTLWVIEQKEGRGACSELIINCGPNSSHFAGTAETLPVEIRKLPAVADMPP